MDQTKRDEYQRDPGWDTVDNIPQYTHEEYLEFERRRHEEIQRLIAEGKVSPCDFNTSIVLFCVSFV